MIARALIVPRPVHRSMAASFLCSRLSCCCIESCWVERPLTRRLA
jgi:hypothetical protein